MSGECDKCGEHCLECTCESLRALQRNDPRNRYDDISGATIALGEHLDPPAQQLPVKYVNVNGRAEHEALIKDGKRCKELGLCQVYEILVYMKRWGSWLSQD